MSGIGPEFARREQTRRYGHRVDHRWATAQLQSFVRQIDRLIEFGEEDMAESIARRESGGINLPRITAENLLATDPVMRDIMNAARPGFGDYPTPEGSLTNHADPNYWAFKVKPWALRAIGILDLGAEAREHLRPDSPDLSADQMHPWVWEAAAPMWNAGSTQEAIAAAARSVNARLQQKIGRHDTSDARLCRDAFSLDPPQPGRPRLRAPGDRTSETWRSRQQGAGQFGAGCFEGIRNPVAHDHGLVLPDQVALEQLAAFSVLARWIDECKVETAE